MAFRKTALACLLTSVYVAVPLVTLAAQNRSYVTIGELVRPLLLVLCPLVIAICVVGWRAGTTAALRLSAVLSVAVLFVFDYRELRTPLHALTSGSTNAAIYLWLVLLGVLVIATLLLARRFDRLPLYMLLAGLVMLAPPAATFADFQFSVESTDAVQSAATIQLKSRYAPDVYLFLLDAHGRPDWLRSRFGYNDRGLLAQLHSEGYVTPKHSRTAYPITALSVPAILQANYVARAGKTSFARANPVMAGQNFVVSSFRRLGYRYALAPSDFGAWNCTGAEDVCLKPSSVVPQLGISDFNWAMLERTPLGDVLEKVVPPAAYAGMGPERQFPSRVVDGVLRSKHRAPVFTFAHVLLSHPPYLYRGPDCRYHARAANTGSAGDREYVEALQCTTAEVSKAAREIAAKDPGAIVVFASDHGSDVDVDHYRPEWQWPAELLRRRFSNFLALRLPQPCRASVPQNILSVNIFRVVLDCISTAHLPQLPAKQYLANQPAGLVRAVPANAPY